MKYLMRVVRDSRLASSVVPAGNGLSSPHIDGPSAFGHEAVGSVASPAGETDGGIAGASVISSQMTTGDESGTVTSAIASENIPVPQRTGHGLQTNGPEAPFRHTATTVAHLNMGPLQWGDSGETESSDQLGMGVDESTGVEQDASAFLGSETRQEENSVADGRQDMQEPGPVNAGFVEQERGLEPPREESYRSASDSYSDANDDRSYIEQIVPDRSRSQSTPQGQRQTSKPQTYVSADERGSSVNTEAGWTSNVHAQDGEVSESIPKDSHPRRLAGEARLRSAGLGTTNAAVDASAVHIGGQESRGDVSAARLDQTTQKIGKAVQAKYQYVKSATGVNQLASMSPLQFGSNAHVDMGSLSPNKGSMSDQAASRQALPQTTVPLDGEGRNAAPKQQAQDQGSRKPKSAARTTGELWSSHETVGRQTQEKPGRAMATSGSRPRAEPSRQRPGPEVFIGQIDVYVDAPSSVPAPTRSKASTAAPRDVSSKYYLRGL